MNRAFVGPALMVLGLVLAVVGAARLVLGDDDGADPVSSAEVSTTEAVTTTAAPTTTRAVTTTSVTTTAAPTTTAAVTTTEATTTAAPTTTTTSSVPDETPAAFLEVLLTAFASGDDATLLARMNTATIERYGEQQCAAYARSFAGQAQDLTIREVAEAAPWDYVTDDRSDIVDGVVAVEVDRVIEGQTIVQELHWKLVDGRFTWFTDCGDPI